MPQIKYTKELVEHAVKNSLSYAGVLRILGLRPSGGSQVAILTRIKNYNIDVSHFTGATWSKGLCAEEHSSLAKQSAKLRTPDELVFCSNSVPMNGNRIAKRLVVMGWEYRCSVCSISEWLGKRLTLHLDHINGTHNDNRLENLRFLCPNCHQQTPTWGNKTRT